MKNKMSKTKKILIISVSAILAFFLVVNPIAAVIVYESIFGMRYEPESWRTFSAADFDSLTATELDIHEGGERITAYKYKNPTVVQSGVVIVAHGLGGGGHNEYMPVIDELTDHGYYVFTYDATGNGKSDGDDVAGLPQGVIDLDRVINTAHAQPEYDALPIYLLGHSWGAYSVGSVLAYHPEITAAVMLSGFDASDDMIREGASRYVGTLLTDLTIPYVRLYEWLKFGDWSGVSMSDGLAATDARVLVVHSIDDATVPTSAGFDSIYEQYVTDSDVDFTVLQNSGHGYLFYSAASREYLASLEDSYFRHLAEQGIKSSDEALADYMSANLDKSKAFELDADLMEQIFNTFSTEE